MCRMQRALLQLQLICACCRQAQKWLGIRDAEQVLASAPEDENFTKPRPAGLGLGAKYLPHHKVTISLRSLATLPSGLIEICTGSA